MSIRPKILFVLVLLVLSGCANDYELKTSPSSNWSPQGFTLKELDDALSYTSPVKKLWALKALENKASSAQRIDLLALECFYSLEMVPSSPRDRQAFSEAVAKLHSEAMRTSPYKVPDDAVIFMLLGGYDDVSHFIDAKTRNTFLELSDPSSFTAYRGSVKKQAETSLKKNLAKASYYYVKGEMSKSNEALETAILRQFSLSLDEKEQLILPEHLKSGSKAPWQIFKWRLEKETGIRLDESLSRLKAVIQNMAQTSF